MALVIEKTFGTYIDSGAPTTPDGAGYVLYTLYPGGRTLIGFDLRGIASTSATELFIYPSFATGGNSTRLSRVLLPATVAATWNTYDGSGNWNTPGCDGSGNDYTPNDAATLAVTGVAQWFSVDVTAQVAAAVGSDYIVRLIQDLAGDEVDIASGLGGNGPYLSVTGTLAAVSDLSGNEGTDGAVALTWTQNPLATGYRVYVGTGSSPRLVASVGAVGTATVYVQPGPYTYRVKAFRDDSALAVSAFSNSFAITTTGSPRLTLDFGNGVVAGGKSTDDVRIISHSGLDYPTLETAMIENSVLDGGVLGTPRSKMRRMTLLLDFGTAYTRNTAAAAFSPGVLRTLTSPRGTIDYYVDAFTPTRVALSPSPRASLALIAAEADPQGAEVSETVDTSGNFASYSEVSCRPVITATLPADSSGNLVIVSPGGTTTLAPVADSSGNLWQSGDVVVIDAQTYAVTVDGAAKLAWFDRDGAWPRLDTGFNDVTATLDGAALTVLVEWRPLLLGLVV